MTTLSPLVQVWQRIETWLRQHAPGSHAELGPPATDAELDEVAATIGTQLPAELTTWWRRANGLHFGVGRPRGLLIPSANPYPTSMALDRRQMHLHVQENTFPAQMTEDLLRFVADQNTQPAATLPGEGEIPYWLPLWLPFAGDAAGGGYFIDLRHGPQHGCLVRYDREHRASTPQWPSLTALWTSVADQLESDTVEPDDQGYIWLWR